MTLLDYVLGDRAGTYVLVSCLLITTLAIIAAIIDIPRRALEDAGLARSAAPRHSWRRRIAHLLGAIAALVAFSGAGVQAFVASSPSAIAGNTLALFLMTNLGFILAVLIWGLTPPLVRHWGLCLGAFGLGLAALFLLLAGILHLHFEADALLPMGWERAEFGIIAGAILLAVGSCLASILALAAYILGGTLTLVAEHRRHATALAWSQAARAPLPARRLPVRPQPRSLPHFRDPDEPGRANSPRREMD